MLRCGFATVSLVMVFMAISALAQPPSRLKSPVIEAEAFRRKSLPEQRRALIAAIDSYQGIARQPVVRAEGTSRELHGVTNYGGPLRSPAIPRAGNAPVKSLSKFSCLFDQNRAWCTGTIPHVGADGVSIDRYQQGFDGHKYVRLNYDNTRLVRARITCPSAGARGILPMLYHGLVVGLGSFDYAAAPEKERGSMQRFIEEADAIDFEEREGKPLAVHVRKRDGTREYVRTFVLDPLVHCIRTSRVRSSGGGGSTIAVEIDYDWRDRSWLPVRTVRTASVTPRGDDDRVRIASRIEAKFTKLEFLDSAADEEFLPKIPKGIPVTDECNPEEVAAVDNTPESPFSWWVPLMILGLLVSGGFSGWWYVRRHR